MERVKKKKYPVMCAWCLEKGRETVVNWSTAPNSHGICDECAGELRRESRKYKEAANPAYSGTYSGAGT